MVNIQLRFPYNRAGQIFGVLLLALIPFQAACATPRPLEKDEVQRFEMALSAAKMGDPTAQLLVAEMFGKGEGTKMDCSKAILWMERAARAGQTQAQLIFGTLLCQGYCGRHDAKTGLLFVRESGINGDGRIREAVARIFGRGTCGVRSRPEAYAWLVLAGDEEAQVAARKLMARMTPEEKEKAESRLMSIQKELSVVSPVPCPPQKMNPRVREGQEGGKMTTEEPPEAE